jgi:hypothetical protein
VHLFLFCLGCEVFPHRFHTSLYASENHDNSPQSDLADFSDHLYKYVKGTQSCGVFLLIAS